MAEIIRERVFKHQVGAVSHDYNDRGSTGFLIGLILIIVVMYVLFMYGLPMVKAAMTPSDSIPEHAQVTEDMTAQK